MLAPKMPSAKLPDDQRISAFIDVAAQQATAVNPNCAPCMASAKPFIIFPMRVLACCAPVYAWAYHYFWLILEVMPRNVVKAVFGVALCFFGGTYVASIAAIEAFRQMGFHKVMADLAVVRAEYARVADAQEADAALGAAHFLETLGGGDGKFVDVGAGAGAG